ncbi:MAG: hypothetical protein CM15mP41_0300 [Flammeovirgaceae bacterium]|nr:MAG: hypothetical protein CM15mP41_0300 [Flammeovirgaceae bacterium]
MPMETVLADHLEVGSTVTINSYRDYFLSEGNDTAQYFVNYSVTGTTKLHWQVSTDNGSTWADINAGDNGTATTETLKYVLTLTGV